MQYHTEASMFKCISYSHIEHRKCVQNMNNYSLLNVTYL